MSFSNLRLEQNPRLVKFDTVSTQPIGGQFTSANAFSKISISIGLECDTVVSNFGDTGEIHAHAKIGCREQTRREPRLRTEILCARMCILPSPTIVIAKIRDYRRVPKIAAPVTFGISRPEGPQLSGGRYFREAVIFL